MGLCQSEEERKQVQASRAIDRRLTEARRVEERIIKLLLLGTGECGKTTLIKQMRILHANGYTPAELLQYRPVVYSNTLRVMGELLAGMRALRIPFDDPNRLDDAQLVERTLERGKDLEAFSKELASALERLWADHGVNTKAYSQRLEFHLHESAGHFFDNLKRISATDYCPTYVDLLLTRVPTAAIVEVDFHIQGMQLRVVDVGGQRSHRKKWIHCFENVNSLIYVTAISEYDQVLMEDNVTNRLRESMRLFETICNSRWFLNTSIILFLNKKDLFEEKLRFFSIRECFPDYTGPQSYADSIAYLRRKFSMMNANLNKTIFIHETCATDTHHVQLILNASIETIIQSNLNKTGI